jgi:NADH pyrophosphatase NudC (nudix superfamily)
MRDIGGVTTKRFTGVGRSFELPEVFQVSVRMQSRAEPGLVSRSRHLLVFQRIRRVCHGCFDRLEADRDGRQQQDQANGEYEYPGRLSDPGMVV